MQSFLRASWPDCSEMPAGGITLPLFDRGITLCSFGNKHSPLDQQFRVTAAFSVTVIRGLRRPFAWPPQKNSSPQQLGRQLRNTVCSSVGVAAGWERRLTGNSSSHKGGGSGSELWRYCEQGGRAEEWWCTRAAEVEDAWLGLKTIFLEPMSKLCAKHFGVLRRKFWPETFPPIFVLYPIPLTPVKNGGYIPRSLGYIPKILISLFPCEIPVEARSPPEAKITN